MGVKNTLADLNDHLFEQLERLNDDELTDEELEREVKRGKAMEGIATRIVGAAHVVLKAKELIIKHGAEPEDIPRTLIGQDRKNSIGR